MTKGPGGRPRKGVGGTRVKDYPRLPVYLSPEQKARLDATSEVLGKPSYELLLEAFDAFYRVGLTKEQRREVERRMKEGGRRGSNGSTV